VGLRGPRATSHADFQTGPPRRKGPLAGPKRRPPRVTPEAIRAFLTGDEAYFRRALGLEEPWQDTPLVDRRDRCTAGHAIKAAMPGHGCHDQHAAWALRRQLIAELERRGRFHFADLDNPSEDEARVAWGRLADVARAVGISEQEWVTVLRASGWEDLRADDEEGTDAEVG
jgi:hypothetical protein